ncbi:MAG: hypothetical protein R6U37_09465 [Dehalococcoidia bacterium]
MDIEAFVLCDAATNYQGRLNILGTFDSIWVRQLPASHPHCAVALRLRFSRIEEGEHKVKINIIDEDGQSIAPPLNANANLVFKENSENSVATNLIMNVNGLKLEKYGNFAVDLAIDGRQEASLPLKVRKPPEAEQPPEQ